MARRFARYLNRSSRFSPETVEDIVQECALAYSRRSEHVRRPPEWMRSTVRNQFAMERRRLARSVIEYRDPEEMKYLRSASEGPSQILRIRVRELALLAAPANVRHRLIFTLAVIYGYRHSEVARLVGGTEAGVRKVIYRMRERLRSSARGSASP